ncbi:hypothetical protein MGMO_93c00280 [Methyloglobulus morosus KoM1]|uniref:Uncharacterized protein n=1 Tax=Methyloglobulus morosus KoM1 TaxID=1116472 RepID=V5BEH3_9GAMM|nr:hypothetical protein MGMO_93c00280 [Methyloglobulus morosus KoM1]
MYFNGFIIVTDFCRFNIHNPHTHISFIDLRIIVTVCGFDESFDAVVDKQRIDIRE